MKKIKRFKDLQKGDYIFQFDDINSVYTIYVYKITKITKDMDLDSLDGLEIEAICLNDKNCPPLGLYLSKRILNQYKMFCEIYAHDIPDNQSMITTDYNALKKYIEKLKDELDATFESIGKFKPRKDKIKTFLENEK